MDPILVLPVLIALVILLFVIKKRQKAGERPQSQKKNSSSKSSSKTKTKKNSATARKKTKSSTEKSAIAPANEKTEQQKVVPKQDWDWNASNTDNTTVSVATVDHLTEYKVYKQFGYFQKAAESLSTYLEQNASKQSDAMISTLVTELTSLGIQAKNPDIVSEVIDRYRAHLNRETLENLIRQGLALDENHLGLRVLAEDLLQWDVKDTDKEAGVNHDLKPDTQMAETLADDQ